jgi:cytidyltransferase-like protein
MRHQTFHLGDLMKKLFILFCLFCAQFASSTEPKIEKPVRVYVDIVGDLFHSGHVKFLKKARALGNYLIVGILADDVVQGYKREPILTLEERTTVIEACKYVDEVVIAPPLRLTKEMIDELQIDLVVHGDDFNEKTLYDQYALSLELGIFRSVPYTPGVSTTNIIDRITSRYVGGEFRYSE